MVTCEICGQEFKNTQGLRGHKNFVHRKSPSTNSVAQVADESQLSKLEARLQKLEYITGLAEMNVLEDLLSDDKPLTEKITEVTEQLNQLTQQLTRLSSNTASSRDLHSINEKVSRLAQQLSNCSKWFEPVSTAAGTMSRLDDELSKKAQNTRVNTLENRVRHFEEESERTVEGTNKCIKENKVIAEAQIGKTIETVSNVVDKLATAIKELQDQVKEQKLVTDWVKKENKLRVVQKAR